MPSYSRFSRRCADEVRVNAPLLPRRPCALTAFKLLATSAVVMAFAGWAGILVGQDHPPLLLDLSQLKLKVSSSEVVDSVCTFERSACVSHVEGENKLVVVTLSGALAAPAMVSLQVDDFSATPADATFFRPSTRSVAVNVNGFWAVDKGKEKEIVGGPQKAGQIAIKAAFLLKPETSAFVVSYPALVAGRASAAVTIPTETRTEQKGIQPGVRIPFVQKTKSFRPGSPMPDVIAKNPGEVVLVIRIEGEGLTPDTVLSNENPPHLMIAGRSYGTATVYTAAEHQAWMGDKLVTTKPWLVVVFFVPEDATNIRFQVGNRTPVPVVAASKTLDELRSSDVH